MSRERFVDSLAGDDEDDNDDGTVQSSCIPTVRIGDVLDVSTMLLMTLRVRRNERHTERNVELLSQPELYTHALLSRF